MLAKATFVVMAFSVASSFGKDLTAPPSPE
jgi:hypothetical protein